MLTGSQIIEEVNKGNIVIEGFNPKKVNPNSYNLRLHNILKVYDCDTIDSIKPNKTKTIIIPEDGYRLEPNKLYLGCTKEYTETHNLIPCLSGRSSIGRLGISVHVTAGFGDIGYCGMWTLEIFAIEPVVIYPNMEICQIYYQIPDGNVNIQYEGRYQNSKTVYESKLHIDYDTINKPEGLPLSVMSKDCYDSFALKESIEKG